MGFILGIYWDNGKENGIYYILAHITLGRQKDPFFINIRNPIPQKVSRIPNIDPVLGIYWENGKENGNYYIIGPKQVPV